MDDCLGFRIAEGQVKGHAAKCVCGRVWSEHQTSVQQAKTIDNSCPVSGNPCYRAQCEVTCERSGNKLDRETLRTDPVIDAVRADLHRRSQLGIKKYGTTLAENSAEHRAQLEHIYNEVLDAANYLKWAMMEIDRKREANDSDGTPM